MAQEQMARMTPEQVHASPTIAFMTCRGLQSSDFIFEQCTPVLVYMCICLCQQCFFYLCSFVIDYFRNTHKLLFADLESGSLYACTLQMEQMRKQMSNMSPEFMQNAMSQVF